MSEWREGIFFGMPEAEYHSVPALSNSLMKWLNVSPYDAWIRSSHNPNLAEVEAEETSSEARTLGRAFHKRIIEGRPAFDSCYAEKVEPTDDMLVTAEDLKEQCRALGLKISGSKAEIVERLLDASPTLEEAIWDCVKEDHAAKTAGKQFLTGKWLSKIELAAAHIEKHPQLKYAFADGAPEVSIFWTCPVVGVRCKARLDYLKPRAVVDLKTLENQRARPLTGPNNAIHYELAARNYYRQATFYLEAASHAAEFILAGRHDVGLNPSDPLEGPQLPGRLLEHLADNKEKRFLFVMQVKGVAPQAFGEQFSPEQAPGTFAKCRAEIEGFKQQYRLCLERWGSDVPWIEDRAIGTVSDGDVPAWA